MAEESYPVARFDHVSSDGNLIFRTQDSLFTVELNDTLEHAILEAKQIRAEQHEETPVHQQKTLPISQIQALIRAGADPDQVANKYHLNSALVRRFAAPVASEKAYAIEQFLRVPAPKEAKVHSLADIIERTLAAAKIPRESVQWKATRRGLEPWRITASFQSAGHPIHAEWSWNMHANTVVCINNAARKLIGEINTAPITPNEQDEALNQAFPSSAQLPGDSPRSARIELAVSQWNKDDQQPHSAQRQTPAKTDDAAAQVTPKTNEAPANTATGEDTADTGHHTNAAQATAEQQSDEHTPSKEPAQDEHATKSAHKQRSPIPSWDEIMFGKAPTA